MLNEVARRHTTRKPAAPGTRVVLTILCSAALCLSLGAPTALSLDLTKLPKVNNTENPGGFKYDDDKCDVTDQMIYAWIDENEWTRDLNNAHLAIKKAFANPNTFKFAHDKSLNKAKAKDDAIELTDRHRAELWQMASKIVGNLIPACDQCRLLNNWGKLAKLQDITGDRQFGKQKVGDLTQYQMADPKVIKEIDDYFIVRQKSRSPDIGVVPENAGLKERNKWITSCNEEITTNIASLSKLDESKCTASHLRAVLDTTAIGAALDDSLKNRTAAQVKADKRMDTLSEVRCRPRQDYRYLNWAPLR